MNIDPRLLSRFLELNMTNPAFGGGMDQNANFGAILQNLAQNEQAAKNGGAGVSSANNLLSRLAAMNGTGGELSPDLMGAVTTYGSMDDLSALLGGTETSDSFFGGAPVNSLSGGASALNPLLDGAAAVNPLLLESGLSDQSLNTNSSPSESLSSMMNGPSPMGELLAQALSRNPSAAGKLKGELNGELLYQPMIQASAAKYGVDPALIRAVISQESDFDPNAVSSAGAKGLMQLMDGTAKILGVNDVYDPAANIEGGTRYLSDLLHKYHGNTAAALAAYNAGPDKLDKLGISNDAELYAHFNQLPRETQNYVSRVLRMRNTYDAQERNAEKF